jgi:uncharacterized protein YkwD
MALDSAAPTDETNTGTTGRPLKMSLPRVEIAGARPARPSHAEGTLVLRRFASALVVALSTLAAIGTASPAQASNAGSFIAQINADRSRAGRAPFVHRADLAGLALTHSQTMAAKNSLYHNPNLTKQVANWQAVGENVGMGGNTRVLHAAFMNSPAHRANILDRDFTEIGLGVIVDARGVMWVTEVFRRPLRVASRTPARAVAATSSAGTTTRPATASRLVAKRPATPNRPAVRWATARSGAKPHGSAKSAWLSRMSTAAAAPATRSNGALPQAVDYLHVVAG